MQDLIKIIDSGFENGGQTENDADRRELATAVDTAIEMLDSGKTTPIVGNSRPRSTRPSKCWIPARHGSPKKLTVIGTFISG
jgi:plasmid stabilization system protein ParE